MKNNSSAQLQDCLFTLKCKRKHFLMDKEYFLHLFENEIYICRQVNLFKHRKKQQISKSKYQLELNLSIVIHFFMKDQKLQAFGLQFATKFKQFHAQHDDLLILKQKMRNKVMFSHVLDFYEPKKILGSGVSSQVYLIYDYANKIEFASKCIPKTYLQEDKQKRQDIQVTSLHTEIKILRKLNHPSILQVQEVYEGQQTYYIILELLKGPTLSKLIRSQSEPFEHSAIRKMFTKILEAVSYIHSNNIIHRDIKPENIMLRDALDFESIQIIDFGFSTECDVQSYLYPKCGTPGYVAPEIINLQDLTFKYSSKCDLFSCGVILYKLFTRQNLFPGANTEAILKLNKKCHLNLSLLALYRVPKSATDLIIQLLKLDPIERISAQDALNHPFITGLELQIKTDIKHDEKYRQQSDEVQSLLEYVHEPPQTLPFSNKPYFKIKDNYGSLVIKQTVKSTQLNVNFDNQKGHQVFSPQETENPQNQANTFTSLKQKSVGGEQKKQHFIYFKPKMPFQEEIPEVEDDDLPKINMIL